MFKRLGVIAVSSFAVGIIVGAPAHSSPDQNILYRAVVKLIVKYEGLKDRLLKLENRVERLENRLENRLNEKNHYIEVDNEISLRHYAVVRTWLRFRSGPSKKAKVLFILRPNEVVEVLGENGEWYKVRTKEGYIGYVHSDYLVLKE